MKCPECGAGVNEKSIACENCGFPFQKRTQASTQNSVFTNDISYMKCSECGANVNEKGIACKNCGFPFQTVLQRAFEAMFAQIKE